MTGPDAVRLWEVNQSIEGLRREATVLLGRLRQPAADSSAEPSGVTPAPTSFESGAAFDYQPYPAPAGRTESMVPRKHVGAQQLLLGLGALLALSAASIFVLAVWILVGLVGQVIMMVGFTLAAAYGARVATKRGLLAAAETGAVLATGLLGLDLVAAHARNLAGLGDVSLSAYWAGAAVVMAAVLLGFDALIPAQQRDGGVPASRVRLYRPVAAVCLTLAPWLVSVVSGYSSDLVLMVVLAGVAVVNAATGWAAVRLDRHATVKVSASGNRSVPLSAVIAWCGAVLALGAFYLLGVQIAYDQIERTSVRYCAALLLLIPTLALAGALASVLRRSNVAARVRRGLWATAAVAAVPALGVPVTDAPWQVFWAAALPVAAAAGFLAWTHSKSTGKTTTKIRGVALVTLLMAQPVLFVVVLVLWSGNSATIGDLYTSRPEVISYQYAGDAFTGFPADTSYRFGDISPWLLAVPGLLWALVATLRAFRSATVGQVITAQVAWLATILTALSESEPRFVTFVLVPLVAGEVGLALHARACAARTAPDPTEEAALDRRAQFVLVEGWQILFGGIYAALALIAAVEMSADWTGTVLVAVGVLTLIYAGASLRVTYSYLGSLLVSAGTDVFLASRDVQVVEAYTAPLALLLAAVGVWQWLRSTKTAASLPTRVTMGPALTVAMMPSLLTAIINGDETRMAASTAVAVVVLILGLARGWKAPVTLGGIALILVALTQGGPLLGYIPAWLTIGGAGAVLLTVGVMWESALSQGRRANTWYTTLR